MVASAVEGSHQVPIIGKGSFSNLGPIERGYLIGPYTEGEHSLSACTLDRRSTFVAQSVVLINIEKSAG